MADAADTLEEVEVEIPPHRHPLLMEDILDKIFPYFDDPKNLGSFRLVSQSWNKSAARTVKKNLRWKIGSTLHSEMRFMEVMANCTDDIFGNFLWTHSEKTPNMNASDQQDLRRSTRRKYLGDNWHKYVQPFLEKFGPLIVNLELRARDPTYVDRRLRSSFLPNLEHLELYDLSEAVLTDTESFQEIKFFGKLKSVCFNPKIFHDDDEIRNFNEGKALICDKILEAASALKELEINLPKTTSRLLKGHEPLTLTAFASLTSFTISPRETEDPTSAVALDKVELQNLLERSPNLKILRVTTCAQLKETDIYGILAKYKVCAQLEELHIAINCEDYEYTSDDSDMSLELDSDHEHSDSSSSSDKGFNRFKDSVEKESTRAGELNEMEPEHEESDSGTIDDVDRAFIKADVRRSFAEARLLELKRRASAELGLDAAPSKKKIKSEEQADKKKRWHPILQLPEMPKLKKLGLHNWKFSDYDLEIFPRYPLLREVDLELSDSPALSFGLDTMVGLDERGEHSCVKYLKLRDCSQDLVNWEGIAALSQLFPNLEELDVKVEDDHTLTSIFVHMTKLKRLHLNDSEISDSGITGLPMKLLKTGFEKSNTLSDVKTLRERTYIGNLIDLQELTYTGRRLTKYSIHFGIAALKNLTSLKLKPPRRPYSYSRKWVPLLFGYDNDNDHAPVDIRPLLTNCKYLVKLDVNGESQNEWGATEDSDFTDDSDVEDVTPRTDFKGCGLKEDQIKLVKETFPNLDLVYGEKDPRL